jgi:putative salt-induced outer membrane protein YdiY
VKLLSLSAFIIVVLTTSSVYADESPWHDETEIGTAIVSGNTNTQTINGADKTSFQWDNNVIKLTGRYLQSSANGLQSALNWDTSLRYERILDEKFSLFTSYGLESDVFSGYIQRNNFDLGGKYYFSKSPDTTWTGELGYQNSFTQYVTPTTDAQSNYVRVYSEVNQIIMEGISGRLWAEYLFSVSDSKDYLFNAEPSITMMVNKIFSLKTAYLMKYHNNAPAGFKQLDSFYTLSVVAKF